MGGGGGGEWSDEMRDYSLALSPGHHTFSYNIESMGWLGDEATSLYWNVMVCNVAVAIHVAKPPPCQHNRHCLANL